MALAEAEKFPILMYLSLYISHAKFKKNILKKFVEEKQHITLPLNCNIRKHSVFVSPWRLLHLIRQFIFFQKNVPWRSFSFLLTSFQSVTSGFTFGILFCNYMNKCMVLISKVTSCQTGLNSSSFKSRQISSKSEESKCFHKQRFLA